MPQVTEAPTRGKLLKEPERRALEEAKFPLSGQWLPIGAEKMSFFDLKDLERLVPESEDPEFHELVSQLFKRAKAAHVWVEQRSSRAWFFVQLRSGLGSDPVGDMAAIGRILEKYRA